MFLVVASNIMIDTRHLAGYSYGNGAAFLCRHPPRFSTDVRTVFFTQILDYLQEKRGRWKKSDLYWNYIK